MTIAAQRRAAIEAASRMVRANPLLARRGARVDRTIGPGNDHTVPALLDTSTSPTTADREETPVVTDVSEDGANRDRTGDLLLAKQHGPARSKRERPAHGGYPGVAHFYPGASKAVGSHAISPGIDHTGALSTALDALLWYANASNWNRDDWGIQGVINPPDYGKPGHVARAAVARIGQVLDAASPGTGRAALIETAAKALADRYVHPVVMDFDRRDAELVLVAVGLIPATTTEDA